MSEEQQATSDGANSTGTTNKRPRGRVAIAPERCKGCGYCVEFCPLGVLVMASRFNAKGYHYPEVANEEKCSGCDLCGIYCPDFAISGARIPRKKPEKEQP